MSELTTKDALLERAVAALEKLKSGIDVINPVGVVQAYAGNTVPDGWLLCDGSAVSRETYADLYGAIGDTYGAGDGSTTFNLPDLADKFIEGSATSGTVKEAGLPNITGRLSADQIQMAPLVFDGAFSAGDSTAFDVASGGSGNNIRVISLDASRSSDIYGKSTTVQPPALTMQYVIKC